MKVEVRIGDGTIKPKVVKCPDGTYVIQGKLEQGFVAHRRALWMKTYRNDQPVDGKGFVVGPTGKLTKG